MTGIYHIHAEGCLNRAKLVNELTNISSSEDASNDRFLITFSWSSGLSECFLFTDLSIRDLIFSYALNAWSRALKGDSTCVSLLSGTFEYKSECYPPINVGTYV